MTEPDTRAYLNAVEQRILANLTDPDAVTWLLCGCAIASDGSTRLYAGQCLENAQLADATDLDTLAAAAGLPPLTDDQREQLRRTDVPAAPGFGSAGR